MPAPAPTQRSANFLLVATATELQAAFGAIVAKLNQLRLEH